VSVASRQRWSALGLTAPAYLWLVVTVFLPLSAMFYFSFLTVAPFGGREAELTLKQYTNFFAKDFYLTLTWRSLELGLWVTVVCILVGYPAALVLAKTIRGRWREALLLLVVLPFWSNALVRVFSWTMVLRSDGLVDRLLDTIIPGFPSIGFLYSYPAIIVGLVHTYLPYMILTCYLSLQAIDDTLLEAARSLGAPWWKVFWRITLPLSLPGLLVGVILIFIPVIGSFMEPRILGGRSGIMLGTIIEDQFTELFNWPFGAALSFLLLAIVLVLLGLSTPLLRRNMRALD
jgi:spermidine/putrescine transport system permease protein